MSDGDFSAVAFDPEAPDDPSKVKYWRSPRTNFSYALWWRITVHNVPVDGMLQERPTLRFEAWPRYEDQELSTVFKGPLGLSRLAFPFWEGLVEPRAAELVWQDRVEVAPADLVVFGEQVTYGQFSLV